MLGFKKPFLLLLKTKNALRHDPIASTVTPIFERKLFIEFTGKNK